ncbi:universal stress protein UspA [Roseovarius sp. HI0049]|nr:universal stress protein UspA [Roseovarius sp. HI0049]
MFNKIMTPVDLAHKGDLQKALACAADLARHYGAEVVYVGVTAAAPSSTAHNPEEFDAKLKAFAEEQGSEHGITVSSKTEVCHDPSTDVDNAIIKAAKDTGADLVIMASHVPNVLDIIWPSNGGSVAEHVDCSVMVVRS